VIERVEVAVIERTWSRRRYVSQLLYASVLYARGVGLIVEPETIERLEIEARLEKVANSELRRGRAVCGSPSRHPTTR